jgi:hypothetical protein
LGLIYTSYLWLSLYRFIINNNKVGGKKKGQEEREQEMEDTGDDTVEPGGSTCRSVRSFVNYKQTCDS